MNAPDVAKTVFYACGSLAMLAFGWTSLTVGHHAAFSLGKFDQTVSSANETLEIVNRPCGAKDPKGKLLAPGTLCDVGKAVVHLSDITVAVQKQAIDSSKIVGQFSKTLDGVSIDTHAAMINVQELAGSLAETGRAATAAIQTTNTSIAQLQPVLMNATRLEGDADGAVTRINGLLDLPEVPSTIKNLNGMTASGNSILEDAAYETHKFVHPPPQKWYVKVWTYGKTAGELLYDFIR